MRFSWSRPQIENQTLVGEPMLNTVIVVLVILWLLGALGGYAFGGAIHILLVIALIVIIVRVLQGRKPIP